MKQFLLHCIILSLFGAIVGCTPLSTLKPTPSLIPDPIETIEEARIKLITLLGQISEARAEISGMAWCGDHLILLPQYPGQYRTDDTGYIFSIPRDQIINYLNVSSESGIKPEMIPFDQGGLDQSITGFEGFEAITFSEDQFFVSIESRQDGGMMGYLVQGEVQGDCDALVVDPNSIIEVAPQADLSNMSDETLLFYQDQLFSIYEANGENVNPDPVTHVFDLGLDFIEDRPLPNVEYRITDATEVDENGVFWAMNYFFPGDTKLKPGVDQIALEYGLGHSHVGAEGVERIIAMQITDAGVILADEVPLYIELYEENSRNWESIVCFEDGFLIVTDEYPTTLLAFVENIDQ